MVPQGKCIPWAISLMVLLESAGLASFFLLSFDFQRVADGATHAASASPLSPSLIWPNATEKDFGVNLNPTVSSSGLRS
jgi:hypothetical protein